MSDPAQLNLIWHGRQTDWLLQRLVQMVNNTELEFGITLTVGAGLVSGQLISGKQYFKTISQAFAGASPDETEEIRSAFNSLWLDEDEEGSPPVQFVHLKNARFFISGSLAPHGVLWRGTIASISGFNLGELSD
ncbi:gas vesicle accessory protein GvpU [Pseudomonas sp. RIT-PI-AD]|uniref:gas vesicle accessory protein GvpU n=1 Tax=Pseudomonas sp. RIT-PI-AD TaxID=3035294 RepID=UPI0021D824CF|nr:gas vesicle accessory protein GvpU [Pseudomonas sp. RIT-PI-AD]